MKSRNFAAVISAMTLFVLLSFPMGANADHSWGNYHWARTSNPFTIRVVDSNTVDWDGELNSALFDWSQASVLDMTWVAGSTAQNTRKRCAMVSGQVRSCNASYGFNGWLGLASINITGGVHITQGSSKMNDSYFNGGGYNETNRRHVMCQELGHTLGLGHTSEDGSDQNTCMDYSNDLGNPSPNSHDYAQLSTIYQHLDSTTTIGFASSGSNGSKSYFDENAPENWGRLVRQSANGRSSYYERENWDGSKMATHVFWTIEAAEVCRACDHRYDH